MTNKCINFIQVYLLPQSCLMCHQPTHHPHALCADCQLQLPFNTHCCRSCAVPLMDSDQQLCASCQIKKPAFHHAHIPLHYSQPVSQWIQRFKFNNDLTRGKILADLFCDSLNKSDIEQIDALIPVPLHPSRTRQRGYNQALWLARQISSYAKIPVDHKLVQRACNTPPQTKLNYHQRQKNLQGAFQLSRKCTYTSVAIIDDVVTTGSTVNEVARLLTDNGIETAHIWAIARTLPRHVGNLMAGG